MSFIGAEDDASVICEDTLRSIRDYLKNTHGKKKYCVWNNQSRRWKL